MIYPLAIYLYSRYMCKDMKYIAISMRKHNYAMLLTFLNLLRYGSTKNILTEFYR